MKRLLKTDLQRRTEQIKQLILSDQPFQQELAHLYVDLRLQAKHPWVIQTFYLLSLYLPAEKQSLLYHPALVQAFLSMGDLKQAHVIAQALHHTNPQDPETNKLLQGIQAHTDNLLPAYTPIAQLSRYAAKTTTRPTSSKTPLLLPENWDRVLKTITPQTLQSIGYYDKIKQFRRVPKAYRHLLQENFNQLVLNYIFEYHRAVVVLSGALLESLLMIHAREVLRLTHVSLRGNNRKNLLDASLHELLNLYASKQLLPASVLRLCRAARMQRNFIHPGKELAERTHLTPTSSRICYLAVLELTDALFSNKKTKK